MVFRIDCPFRHWRAFAESDKMNTRFPYADAVTKLWGLTSLHTTMQQTGIGCARSNARCWGFNRTCADSRIRQGQIHWKRSAHIQSEKRSWQQFLMGCSVWCRVSCCLPTSTIVPSLIIVRFRSHLAGKMADAVNYPARELAYNQRLCSSQIAPSAQSQLIMTTGCFRRFPVLSHLQFGYVWPPLTL